MYLIFLVAVISLVSLQRDARGMIYTHACLCVRVCVWVFVNSRSDGSGDNSRSSISNAGSSDNSRSDRSNAGSSDNRSISSSSTCIHV